jgi:hypothetical protein
MPALSGTAAGAGAVAGVDVGVGVGVAAGVGAAAGAPGESAFAGRLSNFAAWRDRVSQALARYDELLQEVAGEQPEAARHLDAMIARLHGDRMSVALVAEFSRGKSELINALFFADVGRRILPSSAGRTTMCPTELHWDAGRRPSVRLLPIETRADPRPLEAWRSEAEAWDEREFDPDDAVSMERALAGVSETIPVKPEQAAALGLPEEAAGGTVAIPRWRHAIVNHPHPLLARGLVIIDTPGLNAIGTEPDLTLRLLPEADAVLFVLAADTGVTRSDVEAWREHVAAGARGRRGLFVVLNKIDGLWDGLRDEVCIEVELARQAGSVASTLGLPVGQVYPVSAQKALVARLRADPALERRSRIRDLERALGDELLAGRGDILRGDFEALHRASAALLAGRRRERVAQQLELNGLNGRNREAIAALAAQVSAERASFDRGLRQLQALRAVLGRHGEALAGLVGVPAARRRLNDVRELMRASRFSVNLRQAMGTLLAAARADLADVEGRVAEMATLLNAMYRSFGSGQGYALGSPARFSLRRHREALEQLEHLQDRGFGAIALVTNEKHLLMRRFFETFASRLCDLYGRLARDCEAWQRAALAPLETRLREHSAYLRRRSDSVRRVLEAGESLEARMAEVSAERSDIEARMAALERAGRSVRAALGDGAPGGG